MFKHIATMPWQGYYLPDRYVTAVIAYAKDTNASPTRQKVNIPGRCCVRLQFVTSPSRPTALTASVIHTPRGIFTYYIETKQSLVNTTLQLVDHVATMAMPPPYPGDDIIRDAVMIYDRTRTIQAPASSIFPWIVQLGKGRGGWYLTSFWERLLPSSWVPSRRVQQQWQTLAVGDRVADYGTSDDDYFDVVLIEPPTALVYKSERYGTVFTWALLCHEHGGQSEGENVSTTVHLRFRGRIQSTGWKRALIVWGGNWIDHWTTAPMLAGLAERVEKPHLN